MTIFISILSGWSKLLSLVKFSSSVALCIITKVIYHPTISTPCTDAATAQELPGLLQSAEALAVVESIARSLSLDIAQIEALHSSNREMALLRSKGWLTSLQTLSSAFVGKTVSKVLGKTEDVGDHDHSLAAADSHMSQTRTQSKTKSKKGGGGAWRAYVHDRMKGTKFTGNTISALSAEYKKLTADEKDKYERAGALAATSHRAGLKSFSGAANSTAPSSHGQSLQPGDQTPDGAIVALDAATTLDLSLQYSGADSFNERYERAKQDIREYAKASDQLSVFSTKLSDAEEQDLMLFSNSATSDSFVEQFQSDHSRLASVFQRVGASDTVSALTWSPPLAPLLKAGGANPPVESGNPPCGKPCGKDSS